MANGELCESGEGAEWGAGAHGAARRGLPGTGNARWLLATTVLMTSSCPLFPLMSQLCQPFTASLPRLLALWVPPKGDWEWVLAMSRSKEAGEWSPGGRTLCSAARQGKRPAEDFTAKRHARSPWQRPLRFQGN